MERRTMNFEILRVLLMYFVVLFHFIVHGVSKSNFLPTSFDESSWVPFLNHFFILLFLPIVSVSVNCYILISGFFLSTKSFKLIRLSRLWLMTLFYSVIIGVIVYCFFPENVDLKNIIGSLTPIKSNTYWFFTKYMALLVLSPFFANWIRMVSQKEYKILLFILGFFNIHLFLKLPYGSIYSGETSLLWFIFLFLMGGYIRKYDLFKKTNEKKMLILSIVISIFFYIIKSISVMFYTNDVFYYSDWGYNGLTFFVSLSVFLWIKRLSFSESKVNQVVMKLAPYTFGVYLIHDNIYFRSILWGKLTTPNSYLDSLLFLPYMFSTCFVIFVVCLSIDYIRERFFKILKINSRVNEWLEKIVYKIARLFRL